MCKYNRYSDSSLRDLDRLLTLLRIFFDNIHGNWKIRGGDSAHKEHLEGSVETEDWSLLKHRPVHRSKFQSFFRDKSTAPCF